MSRATTTLTFTGGGAGLGWSALVHGLKFMRCAATGGTISVANR